VQTEKLIPVIFFLNIPAKYCSFVELKRRSTVGGGGVAQNTVFVDLVRFVAGFKIAGFVLEERRRRFSSKLSLQYTVQR